MPPILLVITIVVIDSNSMREWLTRYLIVPGAHVRIGDFEYQAELYEVFHQTWPSRLGHMVCTPVVLLGALLCLDAVPLFIAGGGGLDGTPVCGVVLAGGLAAYFFGLDAIVGLVSTPVVALLLAASVLLSRSLGEDTLLTGVVLMTMGAILQAASHAFEDLPPPWGSPRGWRPMSAMLREASPRTLAAFGVLILVSFALEWWASFRILGLQLNFLLMRAGLRPDLERHLARRASEILEGAE